MLGINSNLPPDVAVRWVREVPATFDARRSALRRRYRYSILQQPTRPALARGRVWWIREPLDAAAMTTASLHWLGEHDFSAFRAAGCQAKSPRRRLMAVRVARAVQSDGAHPPPRSQRRDQLGDGGGTPRARREGGLQLLHWIGVE